jgi:hypothetical protein
MIDAPSSIDESQRATHKIKPVVFHRQKWSENVEYQLFSKKRIFNNNHMILIHLPIINYYYNYNAYRNS